MPILVQKFGGSSVANAEARRNAVKKILAAKQAGHDVAVVVSAAAGETDRLLAMCDLDSPEALAERDAIAVTGENLSASLMALELQRVDLQAMSFQGFQLPIRTDGVAAFGRITSVGTDSLKAAFRRGIIPVVTGFQGVDKQDRLTTLGRGGSDLTAVALAAALKASACEIYTDVDGVYSADPRLCASARLLPEVSYRFMREAAALGAKVMHDRSVALGMRYQVPIIVRNSFSEFRGTRISNEENNASCVALDRNLAQLNFWSEQPTAAVTHSLQREMPFCAVTQLDSNEKVALVPRAYLSRAAKILQKGLLFINEEVARVSAVGRMALDVAHTLPVMLSAFRNEGIICYSALSNNLSLGFVVPEKYSVETVQVIHSFLPGGKS